MLRLRLAVTLVACGCLFGAGCATTQPWERETLARPEMAIDGTHRQSLRAHYLSVREGAAGGTGSGGGGCGCN